VECLLTQVKFYLNAGLPRKAWVVFRRAATFAQLLGIQGHCSSNEEPDMRKIGVWLQLSQMDKSLSLLLGLSYMIPDVPFRTESDSRSPSSLPPMMDFTLRLAEVAKKIIDRNNQGHGKASISEALNLDEDLENSRNVLPSSWWNTAYDSLTPRETIYETSIVKFWYHNLRIYLHLPFIRRCLAGGEYQYSVHRAVQSSREMIQIYHVLRDSNRPIVRLCNAIDFQVLTAALVIILSLVNNPLVSDLAQQDQDWALIYSLTSIMSRVAQEMPDTVAAQATQLLEDFSKLRYDSTGNDETFHVVLPYFGEICIRRRHPAERVESAPQFFDDGLLEGIQAPDPMGVGRSYAQEFELPLVDNTSYFSMNAPASWPGLGQEWSSVVDFSLQDDWDWYFENIGTG